jgi:lipopolysaccharide/colanic/teichoic acid biosynthesis glycosyltransferase
MSHAKIGRGARLNRCIVGEGAEVEDGVTLRETVVVEQPAKIMDMATPAGPHVPLNTDDAAALSLSGWHLRVRQLYLLGKRIVDTIVAAVALLVLSPVLGLVALAVKLDSPGEVIFRQTRCGRGGRAFTMYKFRSMVANAEEIKKELVSDNEVDGPMFKITFDPRVTRIGRFLRATNLDETPQLWNVLRGDMSLVGPRPLSMDEMRYNPQWRDLRLSVPPGLTGLWQVEGHSKTSFADWIQYDIYYVRNLSPWLDLKIIIRTLFRRFGSGNGREPGRPVSHHA